MTNPLGMLERSAVPNTSKASTAVNEIIRRMKTHSLEVEREELERSIITYMDNL